VKQNYVRNTNNVLSFKLVTHPAENLCFPNAWDLKQLSPKRRQSIPQFPDYSPSALDLHGSLYYDLAFVSHELNRSIFNETYTKKFICMYSVCASSP
jgi:hypothetical protein